jgi:hypothetical protein
VVDNSGSMENTREQVKAVWQQLKALQKAKLLKRNKTIKLD